MELLTTPSTGPTESVSSKRESRKNDTNASTQALVSVVIPAYNCANYLRRSIESALGQTHPFVECIVVNDGSTDDTENVAMSYGPRIKLINRPNGGASAARNTGIDSASGEFIAFLDADDYWHPSKIEKQIRLMSTYPDVVLVSTGFTHHVSSEAEVMERIGSQAATPYDAAFAEIHHDFLPLFRDPYLGTPTVLVRTDRAREIGGFDVTLPIAEDIDFYFKVCKHRSYARINQPLTIIQQRPGSLSFTQPGYRLNLEVLNRLEAAYPEFAAAHSDEFRQQRLRIYESWAARCIIAGRGSQARELLGESKKYGRATAYTRLLIKSYLAGAIAAIKRLGQQTAAK
ncbi:glycosyltransferase family 2 protein [Thauera butanivorans]|uniref:glycosyltransferase family 2 protein n=1 Tax=Thauera butanivorans TaxID=86174 RepID=UPI003AB898C7